MKTIEQKAKAYDKALEIAKGLIENEETNVPVFYVDNIKDIFPELKESEDEKIRKELYDFCIKCSRGDTLVNQQADFQRWASWLEKQGEFKSSKWKEGDVVRYGGVLALVTNGRKAMKSNCEQITIQYPDEWVKAETWERKYFFEELEKQDEQKHANKKEEIDNLHNYLYGEQKLAEWHREDEQNLNVCLSYIPDEFLRRWLTDIIRVKYDKPADKVEPKFKVGDWVVYCNEDVDLITGIEENGYCINNGGYIPFVCASDIRLWTIQDAKAGDVLAFNDGHGNDCIELIKSITSKKIEFWFCLTNGNRYEVFDGIIPYTNLVSREDATPATKEQCDLLFQKMKEAGYEWDAEKKELNTLELMPLLRRLALG